MHYLVIIPIVNGRTLVQVVRERDEALRFIKLTQAQEVDGGLPRPTGFIYRMGEYEEVN